MKRLNLLAIIAISFSLTSLFSCTTELTTNAGTDASLTATAVDEGQASTINDQVISTADDYTNNLDAVGFQAIKSSIDSNPEKTGIKLVMDSITITVDRVGLNDYPKNICLDFGTGVTVKRGNRLKGKIYISISNKMSIANSSRTFKFVDFFVNDNAVKGSKVVTYMGLNAATKPYWTITASDTIIHADGNKVIWNTKRVRTRIDDNNTPKIYWDDTYSITGTTSGVNAKGVAYTMVIQDTNPLIINGNFPFFTKGSVVITTDNKTVLVDYGDGTKDALATATINGVTKQFNLKK
jgi:hypothetical protein